MNQIRHFYVGVKGLIVRDDGKVLLLKPKRSEHTFFIGDWDIPGGRILSHSEGEHRIRTKIKEETGLEDIYSIKPFGSGIIQDASFEEEGQTVGLVLMVYVCRLGNKDQKITLDAGHLEYKWCSPQEAAADLYQFPNDFREKLEGMKF